MNIERAWLRELVTCEAFPPKSDPAKCVTCKDVHDQKDAPLYRANTVGGAEFITCRECFVEKGASL